MTRHGLAMKNHTLTRYRGGEKLRAIRQLLVPVSLTYHLHTLGDQGRATGICDDPPTRGGPAQGSHAAEATERRSRATRPPEVLRLRLHLCDTLPEPARPHPP